ncbi:Endocytosis and vacuole integrity protein [Ceratocystis pirilliformis]|uniref:Endocytosis and vacuole integrity protein n=1 Tax=Ceratocystis pirilliformis TaxID=259994 RepID=A0ABR3YLJ5_9PEZI
MTTQLLATELANLVQESKRKHNDLRQAAEKSLEELKSLKGVNETQATAELAQKATFVNPFIIACGTRNAKFTSIAIVCLQRLVVAKALPHSKLGPVLEALSQASSAGLDVQLKILQALPPLLTNYADDVQNELLVTALNICFVLQTSKNAIVNNTSAATLQQLIVAVFDKVVAEDKSGHDPFVGEAPAEDGPVKLRPAAMDAFRIFNDLCLMTENQRPEYLRFTALPQTFGLELIESVLTNHAPVFIAHAELAHILRQHVMPFLISALRGKPNFATSVRLTRILYTLIRRHLSLLPSESGQALDILTHMLDQDTAVWKRALCMEVFRGIFSEPALIRRIFMLYDSQEGEKDVLKTLTATFVRLSTEKPSVIGLGYCSTIPVLNPYANAASGSDQVVLEASGVAGILGSTVEGSTTGISSQWSTVRVPFIDQLDKTEAPPIPESYVYSLVLTCISSLSEGLAKFILPLTVPNRKKQAAKQEKDKESTEEAMDRSFKKTPIPVNPLEMKDHPLHEDIKACAKIIDECWPAILATCSTFLNAALDSEYYHSLVRAFQRIAHVAGLLHLHTPRDAFLTTLGKAAVPPNVFTACLNSGSTKALPAAESLSSGASSLLSNARGLLTRESAHSTGSATAERGKQPSFDSAAVSLNTRNLLCLRALLNLGIALGSTMGDSWRIILGTLQQADFVLFSSGKVSGRTPIVNKIQDATAENEASTLLSNFGSEIKAVETAASRLIESTVDFPNDPFIQVVEAICALLEFSEPEAIDTETSTSDQLRSLEPPKAPHVRKGSTSSISGKHRRVLSVSNVASVAPNQEDMFALAKLGDIATINIERLLAYDPETSGWEMLTKKLIGVLGSQNTSPSVRTRAADILVQLVLEAAKTVGQLEEGQRGPIQMNLFQALRNSLAPMKREQVADLGLGSVASNATDVDIQRILLDGLKNILEICGETLVSGWEVAFEIIDSIFVYLGDKSSIAVANGLSTRSAKLVRPSFNSLQLICSDFLASLPNTCFLLLVDTLYKFSSQDDDLNIALTTVTFFWTLSDFLSSKNQALSITSKIMGGQDVAELAKMAADSENEASDAALWMLLLLRLAAVTADDRLELRNSAIQTLLRIFDAYGDKLSSEAWAVCVQSVIFKLLTSITSELALANDDDTDEQEREDWNVTASVVLEGISGLLANYLNALKADESFERLWKELLRHFAQFLDFKALSINTAVYKALSQIIVEPADGSLSTETISVIWELWARGTPQSKDETKDNFDNQECLQAYVSTLCDLYRFLHPDLAIERVKTMLVLLRQAVCQESVTGFGTDVEFCTRLQDRVLASIKMIRTDLPGVPSEVISQVSEFACIAFEDYLTSKGHESSSRKIKKKRTFVALSKASMAILQDLILAHSTDSDIYKSGAFTTALRAFSRPITLKYQFPVLTRGVPAWKVATTAALEVLQNALNQPTMELEKASTAGIWAAIVDISDGIISADPSSVPESIDVMADQDFDISSFETLRDLIIPTLGNANISSETRDRFAQSLFTTSIMHELSEAESQALALPGTQALTELFKSRPGRTLNPQPLVRYKMSYVCLDQMFSLIAGEADHTPSIMVVPPTPNLQASFGPGSGGRKSGGTSSDNAKNAKELRIAIASSIATFVSIRCALTMRMYIDDTPLRGRMPQPLFQRKELLHILARLLELHSEKAALPPMKNMMTQTRKHLVILFPLLVQTAQVAGSSGDEPVLKVVMEAMAVMGVEMNAMPTATHTLRSR